MTKQFNSFGTFEDRLARLEILLGVTDGSGVGNIAVLIGAFDASEDDLSAGVVTFSWNSDLYSDILIRYEDVKVGNGVDGAIGYVPYLDDVEVTNLDSFTGLFSTHDSNGQTGKASFTAPDAQQPMFLAWGTNNNQSAVSFESGPVGSAMNRVDVVTTDELAAATAIITGRFYCYGTLKAAASTD